MEVRPVANAYGSGGYNAACFTQLCRELVGDADVCACTASCELLSSSSPAADSVDVY